MTTSPKHTHDHPHDHAARKIACCSAEGVGAEAHNPKQSRPYGLAFKIQGMDCAEEVAILRREIGPLVGSGDRLSFDILNGKMLIPDGINVSADSIRVAVAKTGMRAEEWRTEASTVTPDRHRRMQTALTAASGAFVLLGMVLHGWLVGSTSAAFGLNEGEGVPLVAKAAYALAIFCGGRYVVVKAWYAARRLRPDMNLLMTVAVLGALLLGDWLEAASVAFLFALSLALEGWSVGRARRAIAALLALAPPQARLIGSDGAEREVPASEVAVGARFIVRPGERIPLDGQVVQGSSAVNQAPITGESLPIAKERGAEVFAGTVNGDGVLEIVSSKRAEDTTLAHIIKLVDAAQGRRAQAEQWVERFARIYTPIVLLLAIAVAVLPPLALGSAWDIWFYRALVLLVIACPCALVISTPVSIVAALASAARAGILLKGGAYLELPARLQVIAFDKTGTLTEGKPMVVEIQPLNGHTEEELLARAAALETHSTHPLATAIMEFAKTRGINPVPATEIQNLPGKGVSGKFEGRDFWLGSHRYLKERSQETPELHAQVEALERQGCSVVVIGNDDHVCGLITIADKIRPEAARLIQELRNMGVRHLVMLSGDNQATTKSIGAQVGINEIKAELLPVDKVAAIEALVGRYGTVAMIGDGVNDAPAMASASLGIAMGAIGSDAAIEAADIALMSDDLSKLPWLIGHSRRTLGIIRQNIAFSLLVKGSFVFLTFAGIASLWGAIAADVGASLLVVANGLRLLRPQPFSSKESMRSAQGPGDVAARPAR